MLQPTYLDKHQILKDLKRLHEAGELNDYLEKQVHSRKPRMDSRMPCKLSVSYT